MINAYDGRAEGLSPEACVVQRRASFWGRQQTVLPRPTTLRGEGVWLDVEVALSDAYNTCQQSAIAIRGS